MKFVSNRSFILVKPKQPFIDWVNNHDDSEDISPEEINGEGTLYMIPEAVSSDEQEIKALVKWSCDAIFENECWSWYMDEEYLPKDMSFSQFEKWF
jgi:hypothetical protein